MSRHVSIYYFNILATGNIHEIQIFVRNANIPPLFLKIACKHFPCCYVQRQEFHYISVGCKRFAGLFLDLFVVALKSPRKKVNTRAQIENV